MGQDERKSGPYSLGSTAITARLWQDGGIPFAYVSNRGANVDFDRPVIHNASSRGSGEKRACVPSGA
jgi:hypothetical protein